MQVLGTSRVPKILVSQPQPFTRGAVFFVARRNLRMTRPVVVEWPELYDSWEEALEDAISMAETEREQRKQDRIDKCGTYYTYTDPSSLKVCTSRITCKLWRECENCRRLRVEEMMIKMEKLNTMTTLHFILIDDPAEERRFLRRLSKEEYMRFPVDGGTFIVSHYPFNGSMPVPLGDQFHVFVDALSHTPLGKRPSYGLYNARFEKELDLYELKVKVRTYNIDEKSVESFSINTGAINQFIKQTIIHAVPNGVDVPIEFVGDLINESTERVLDKYGIKWTRGINITKPIDPDGFLWSEMIDKGCELVSKGDYIYKEVALEFNRQRIHQKRLSFEEMVDKGLVFDPLDGLDGAKVNQNP